MIAFRNTDIDAPFLWESRAQPPARWHGAGDGPAQYFSSTPEAAWAEFLRRQEIRDPEDLAGIERVLWLWTSTTTSLRSSPSCLAPR